jgi:hypothetical protein
MTSEHPTTIYVSITNIKIKGIVQYARFWYYLVPVVSQAQSSAIQTLTTIMNGRHYTMTVWNSRQEMLSFIHSGAHLQAIKDKVLPVIASEAFFYSYETEEIPDWPEAAMLLSSKGRPYNFDRFHEQPGGLPRPS